VALPAGATAAFVRLGGGEPVALDADGRATLDTTEALPGHYILRAQAELGGRVLQGLQAVRLTAEGAPGVPREVWRRQVPASFRSTPVITPNRLYAADMAGNVYGLQADSGEVAWTYQAPAEVQGGLTLSGQTLLVPTIQGHLLALASTNGAPRWTYQASAAVVAPATVAGGRIYVPAVDGTIHCLRADGELLWQRKVADYSIETPVIVDGGRLYVGAWDQFVRCLAADTGELIWESKGEGSRNRPAPRYYSPADAPPTVYDGRVLAADRNYDLIVLDAADGQRVAAVDGGVSTVLSADGQGVWTKLIGGEGAALAKLDRDGDIIFRVPAIVGSVPSIPAEADGLVAVTANASIVSAHAAADGALLWQYQVSPGLYLPAGAVTRAGVVYVVGMDGSITALTAQ
ncbi:MAG TPA: hypothetical protein DCZ72_15570, partial [Armatimonadetes bacterium]|nr:hypothetical protein [Armatimonadota bacterium]